MPNPYDPSTRNRIPGLRLSVDKVWDLAFYNGKFYAYWGPVPGLALALLKLFYGGPIGDQYLTFIFLSGLLIFSVLLLLRVRAVFFRDVPPALIMLGAAVIALAYPIPWMMNHAAIYEASISAGQFFLIGGLYFAYRGLEKAEPSAFYLFLGSAFWMLAIGSRLLMAFPAAFLVGTALLWALGKNRRTMGTRHAVLYLASLVLPLIAGGLAIAIYNWLRFGSVLETGVRYMLTSENLQRFYSETFRAAYIWPNLRLYLMSPIRMQSGFPFVTPVKIPAPSLPSGPGIYHVEQMTGLLYAIPFAFCSVALVLQLIRRISGTLGRAGGAAQPWYDNALMWLLLGLTGSVLLSLAALLMYFYVAIRFLTDVVPSLLLLSVLGLWQGYRYFRDRPVGRALYVAAVAILAFASVAMSLLLTMSQSYQQFLSHNPHLMRQILLLFGH